MKIGMAGSAMMTSNWKDALQTAINLGYDAFEISCEYPQADPDHIPKAEREKGKETAEKAGIAIALHAPFNSLNFATFNQGIRKESVRQTIEAVNFCADLGGKTVVTHNGEYLIDPDWGGQAEQGLGLQYDLNIDSLKRVAEAAEKRGVILCLENCNFVRAKVEQTLADLVKIKDEVKSPNLKFTLDIGHSRLAEGVESAIKILGKDIRHIHFTDNFGKKDDHLVIGEGNFDYSSFVDFILGFRHIVTLEVVVLDTSPEPARKSLENFKRIIGGGS